jgi:hypothetical protein
MPRDVGCNLDASPAWSRWRTRPNDRSRRIVVFDPATKPKELLRKPTTTAHPAPTACRSSSGNCSYAAADRSLSTTVTTSLPMCRVCIWLSDVRMCRGLQGTLGDSVRL